MLTAVGGVKLLLAESASEASLVPLVSCGDHFLSGVDGLSAFGALGNVGSFERHVWLLVRLVEIRS